MSSHATEEDEGLDLPPAERQWWQFRLSTMLLLVVLMCGLYAWYHQKQVAFRQRKAAVDQLRAMDVTVWPEWDRPEWVEVLSGEVTHVDFSASQVTDDDLRHLMLLTDVRDVNLAGTQVKITNAGLIHLAPLTHLRLLNLSNHPITNDGLRHLREMQELRRLLLDGTRVTDAGLQQIAKLQNLQKLYLKDCEITDAGLRHLRACHRLTELDLTGTKVSDFGMEALAELDLACLILTKTKVSGEGLERLKPINSLVELHLVGTQVTEVEAAKFGARRSGLRIIRE